MRILSLTLSVNPYAIERVLASGLGRAMRACLRLFFRSCSVNPHCFTRSRKREHCYRLLRSLSDVVQGGIETKGNRMAKNNSNAADMSIYEAYLEARDLGEQLLRAHALQCEGILVDLHRVETTLNQLTKRVYKLTA